MKYENEIRIHRDAINFLKRLRPKTKKKVKKVISSLKGFPLVRLDVVKLKGYKSTFRIRVGRIRIIFKYLEKERIIFILKVAFREKVYR